MSQSLAGLERAKLSITSASTTDDRLIEALVAAASDAARRFCGRDFALREYDELRDGSWGQQLLLRHHPVAAVASVRRSPQTVLEVTNTSSANPQARVAVTRTGLELVRVASGARTVDTSVTWASNATLSAVASAVTALGNGWSARASSTHALFPSQDLFVAPADGDADRSSGALSCAGGRYAGLRLHVEELSDYHWHPSGWLEMGWASGLDGREPKEPDYPWAGGPQEWRVQYTAGFAVVPPSVEEAVCLWAAEMFFASSRDPALASQALVGQLSQTWAHTDPAPPPRVRALLAPFRARRV